MLAPLLLLLVAPLQQQLSRSGGTAELQAIYNALDSANVERALTLAERYASAHPRDPAAFLALGDAYAARAAGWRFRALDAYRQARRLSPSDPEPSYRLATLALHLGGDDGERIAREELERILALDPLYKDAWSRWLALYRNAGGRRRVIERLQPYAVNLIVAERIALLRIEEEAYEHANELLDEGLSRDPDNAELSALRAQSAFENGDSVAGAKYYEGALAHADADSTGILWHQVIGIATPAEVRAWTEGIPPTQRGAWLRAFWARRNPNLFITGNHRIAEHFARLRYARKHYPLLHPLTLYHRNARSRAMNVEPAQGEREFHLRCEVFQDVQPLQGLRIPIPGVARARDRIGWDPNGLALLTTEEKRSIPDMVRKALEVREPGSTMPTIFAPLGLDLRDIDTTAARVGYNLATGLDDRGIMYLRFGAPEQLKLGGDNVMDPQCNTNELERWRYPELGEVRFSRPSAFSKGLRTTPEMVFRPMNAEQLETMTAGLTRDASTLPAQLDFGIWTAQFRNSTDASRTDLIVVSTNGELATTLVGNGAQDPIVLSVEGVATLTSTIGRYVLVAHAREGPRLGRQNLSVSVRSMAAPAMSDLLLATAWRADTVSRQTTIGHLRRDLLFASGEPIRVYAELYGLTRRDSITAYHATYRLLRSNNLSRDLARDVWQEATSFEFDRERPSSSEMEREVLDIAPSFVPAGDYLLRLEIQDQNSRARLGRATIAFRVE